MEQRNEMFLSAVKQHDVETVRRLIPSVDINMIDMSRNQTPLLIALSMFFTQKPGYVEIAKLLIDAGADLNLTDDYGNTSLINAVSYKNMELVRHLINKGANVNIENKYHRTALIMAAQINSLEMVKLLLEQNPILTDKMKEMIKEKVFSPEIQTLLEAHYEQPEDFLTAVKNNNIEAVRRLIPSVDINMIDRSDYNRRTPLMIAADKGYTEIAKLLIDARANLDKANKYGLTALMVAIQKGHTEIAKLLINAGADIHIKDNDGTTALISATQNANAELVRYLIDKGANVNDKDGRGYSALLFAAGIRSVNIVKLLLEQNPELTDAIAKFMKLKDFTPEIQGLLEAHYLPRWKGKSRGNIEKFDTLFESEESMRNWSFCPICLGWTSRSDGCMYMKHKCSEMPYYHEKLYNKYKNNAGEISWCTICGRICVGHSHYPLVAADAPKPEPLILARSDPFETDCRISNGGGGLPEKIARIRQLRETAKELQDDVGKISHEEAMNTLVEDAWNAAKLTGTRKLQRIEAAKTWNIPITNFPANVATSAAANVVANANDPTKYSAPVVLSPGVGAAGEGRNAGYEFNSVSFADDIPLIVFKHKDKDGNERVHPQIGKESLLTDLMTSERRGKCFDADCGGLLYPREIEMAFADPKLAPTITEEDKKTLAKYKEWFNKWRAEDAKRAGGRRRRRSTKRGRKAPKRTRNTRRR